MDFAKQIDRIRNTDDHNKVKRVSNMLRKGIQNARKANARYGATVDIGKSPGTLQRGTLRKHRQERRRLRRTVLK